MLTQIHLEDWQEVQRYYGLEKIKNEMLLEPDLDKKTLSFLSVILDTPREKFEAFKRTDVSWVRTQVGWIEE